MKVSFTHRFEISYDIDLNLELLAFEFFFFLKTFFFALNPPLLHYKYSIFSDSS